MRSLDRSALLFLVVAGASGCDSGPPARAASGEVVDAISWQERYATTTDARETKISGGDALRTAVQLLDKHGVTPLRGELVGVGKMDEASLTFTVHTHANGDRTLTMKNCAEPHVCAFFDAAQKQGIVDKIPGLCRNATRCGGK